MTDFVTSALPPSVQGDANVQTASLVKTLRVVGRVGTNNLGVKSTSLNDYPVFSTGVDTLMGFWLPDDLSRGVIAQPTVTSLSTAGGLVFAQTSAGVFSTTGGLAVTTTTTFGTVSGNQYTLAQVVQSLENMGLLAI